MAVLPVVPTHETYQALWALWPADTAESTAGIAAHLAQLCVDPAPSSSASPTSDESINAGIRAANTLKLAVFRDLVNLYAGNDDRYAKLCAELKAPSMRQYDLALRVVRAKEGKSAASNKYTDKNWFGAMYTYAIAWGCLVPYVPERAEDAKLKEELITVEYQLWSNVIAMIAHSTTTTTLKGVERKKLFEAGLNASVILRGMVDSMTAGVLSKTCRRVVSIHLKLVAEFKASPLKADQLAYWKALEGELKDVGADVVYRDSRKAA